MDTILRKGGNCFSSASKAFLSLRFMRLLAQIARLDLVYRFMLCSDMRFLIALKRNLKQLL